MQSPLGPLTERFSRGLTLQQKMFITVGAVLWVVSPFDLDFVPVLGWIDDFFVIKLLIAAWKCPTLPPANTAANAFRALGKFAGSFIGEPGTSNGLRHERRRP